MSCATKPTPGARATGDAGGGGAARSVGRRSLLVDHQPQRNRYSGARLLGCSACAARAVRNGSDQWHRLESAPAARPAATGAKLEAQGHSDRLGGALLRAVPCPGHPLGRPESRQARPITARGSRTSPHPIKSSIEVRALTDSPGDRLASPIQPAFATQRRITRVQRSAIVTLMVARRIPRHTRATLNAPRTSIPAALQVANPIRRCLLDAHRRVAFRRPSTLGVNHHRLAASTSSYSTTYIAFLWIRSETL